MANSCRGIYPPPGCLPCAWYQDSSPAAQNDRVRREGQHVTSLPTPVQGVGGERSEPEGVSRQAAYILIAAKRRYHNLLNPLNLSLHNLSTQPACGPLARPPPLMAGATTLPGGKHVTGFAGRGGSPMNPVPLPPPQAGAL